MYTEKEIYARQENLRKSDKQMASNHIWMPGLSVDEQI